MAPFAAHHPDVAHIGDVRRLPVGPCGFRWSDRMPGEIAFTTASGGDPGCIIAPAAQVIELSPIALLAGLSLGESRNVLSVASQFSFASNQTFFSEGHPANFLILIETGRVKLSRIGRDGSEAILRICGSGEIVDVYDGHHTCSARAMTHCMVLVWDSQQASAMGILYPQIRINLKRILANHLDELEERFCEIATGNAS